MMLTIPVSSEQPLRQTEAISTTVNLWHVVAAVRQLPLIALAVSLAKS